MAHRQEVLNVILAELLNKRGVVAGAEKIIHKDGKRHMPDVIVQYQGLRMAIEGEIAASSAKNKALASASKRVETGIAHLGIGVVYPAYLRDTDFQNLHTEMSKAQLELVVVSEIGDSGFNKGGIASLEQLLRRTFEQLIQEDVVAEAVELIDAIVDHFARVVLTAPGIWGRIALLLGRVQKLDDLKKLKEDEKAAACRVAGLVLLNAMIFHEILAGLYPNIEDLREINIENDFGKLPTIWQYILDEINFYSIFHLAKDVYNSLTPSVIDVPQILQDMISTAQNISQRRSALRHDLMGRVYHRLLSDAKYLGTYYTSIPAAALLLKLALRPKGWDVQWDDAEKLKELKIADLACGTGTLLMAAADAVLDNHVSAAAALAKPVQLKEVHQQISEQILHGYDVLASAIHLTASTLALRSPDVPFKKMNLFAMPYGGQSNQLGSLEFLSGNLAQIHLDISGAVDQRAKQVTGKGTQENYIIIPDLDLCVMNPPFVRSVGGNLLFGSMNDKQRQAMQKKLKKLTPNQYASITSGLGSVFVALSNRHIKEGGRLALVLPKALLSGVSWKKTRDLVNTFYHIDYLVVSHDAERWNFSDSTNLSEALMVATKSQGTQAPNGHRTTIINLWRNPTTAIESLYISAQVMADDIPDLASSQSAKSIILDGKKVGEVISCAWQDIKNDWFLPCAFAQSNLTRAALKLIEGEVWLPTVKETSEIQLCKLGDLGKLGPDRRDIYDGFNPIDASTSYPAFWGHNSKEVIQMGQSPNKHLEALNEPKEGRKLRDAIGLWSLASNLLLAEGMRLNTQKLVAVHVDEAVLSNVWWSFAFKETINKLNVDKALILWLNSTLALLTLIATRDETEGAWVHFKKPSLTAMPVLDVRALSDEQLTKLAAAYDKLSTKTLKSLPEMANDATRAEIDKALADVLNLPDISILRTLLAREPVVSIKRI